MNKDQIDKYIKLGWKFNREGNEDSFISPRMKEIWYLIKPLSKIEEKELIEREICAVSYYMRLSLINHFEKILDDLINQQKLLMRKGLEPEKLIKVSFDVEFK